MKHITSVAALTLSASLFGCVTTDFGDFESEDPNEFEGAIAAGSPNASCPALMSVFPVEGPHNIGYDQSCAGGTCAVSCDGSRANSDYGPGGSSGFHHGIDVFAHRGAVLRAVAPGRVVYAKLAANGSNQVKIQDACGWSYFYGHLESFAVRTGDMVVAGQQVGTMGNSGTGGVHLHFNVSPGAYSDDIDPLEMLKATAPTACGGAPTITPPPPAPTPTPTPGCGALAPGEGLGENTMRSSCDGRFLLIMQGDGNLVLYPSMSATATSALWNTRTFGATPTLWMQADGNLVVYHGQGAVWSSRTAGNPGATLEITNAGTLRVRSVSSATLWSN